MDSLDKLFIVCAGFTVIVTAFFGYLTLRAQGWPLAILTAVIMAPLLFISGLSISETLSRPFGTFNRNHELKVHPAIPIIMSVLYYAVLTALLFYGFRFVRLI